MFEIEMNGRVYEFNFGMGFMRAINKTVSTPIESLKGESMNIGLTYNIGKVIDGDLEALSDVLITANRGKDPRLTQADFDAYIDNENTDIDKLFEDVIGFFKNSNATKKAAMKLLEEIEKQKALEL